MQRKHTTTACQVCRESKSKCDGVKPVCGKCSQKNKICVYSSKDDKRKISLRSAVDILFSRVSQLFEIVDRHGIEVPPLDENEQAYLDQVADSLELPSVRLTLPALPSAPQPPLPEKHETPLSEQIMPMNGISVQDSTNGFSSTETGISFDTTDWSYLDTPDFGMWNGSPSDWPWQALNDFTTFPIFTDDQCSISNLVNQTELGEPHQSGSSETEEEEEIIPKLAARFGSLYRAPDGLLKYHGTAQNHHFLKSSDQNAKSLAQHADLADTAASIALEKADLDLEVPPDLEDHLIHLFFQWHNPCHSTVDKGMFFAAYADAEDGLSDLCSQTLIATMCAIGAAFEGRYHHSFVTFPKPLAEFFADKSKILLEIELDNPRVATVQALLLLSSHEAAFGRETRMWLYSGSAMRLAFDLGLHIDSERFVRQGLLGTAEKRARDSTFWSCVVVNHIWSFNLGRPFRIDGEEVTVAIPDAETCTTRLTENASSPGTHDENVSTLAEIQWISLVTELAPLFRVLYGCVKISKLSLQSLSYQTTTKFLSWRENLPAALRISPTHIPLPHILLLHMAYHNFCILIHRPWTSKSSQPTGKIGPGYEHARETCHTSASEIASLLRIYESHYSFRKMNICVVNNIVSASLILVFALIARDILGDNSGFGPDTNTAANLNTCFRALDELGQSFEAARHHHERLLEIQRHWSEGRNAMTARKRQRTRPQLTSSSSHSQSSSQKRTRMW